MIFLENFETVDLIAELRRRKRLRVASNAAMYYCELSEDAAYMASVDTDIARGLARTLTNDLHVTIADRVVARDEHGRPRRAVRTATLTVLVDA